MEITSVTFYYRVQGDPSYKQLAMTISGGNVSGTIPREDVKAGPNKLFEYYLVMRGSDGTEFTFPENNPETSPYTLPVNPKIIVVKVPVTDPNGNQRFLTITYEE